MTHKELVKKAKFWLQSAKRCNPVFTEKGSPKAKEFPDAIGWTSGGCFIVECKISLSDLRADSKKECRNESHNGFGNWRYFLLTSQLYEQIQNRINDYIPQGWGIVVLDYNFMYPRQIRHHGSNLFDSNIIAERDFLRSRIMVIQEFGR